MIEYILHQSEGLIAVNKSFLQSFAHCATEIHFLFALKCVGSLPFIELTHLVLPHCGKHSRSFFMWTNFCGKVYAPLLSHSKSPPLAIYFFFFFCKLLHLLFMWWVEFHRCENFQYYFLRNLEMLTGHFKCFYMVFLIY